MHRLHRHSPRRLTWTAALALLLSLLATGTLAGHDAVPPLPQAGAVLASTIFTFDGKDFVRSQTTLVNEQGKSAVNTKLEHDQPAYKALMEKKSYSGDVTVFGKRYDARYAPMLDGTGRLTGALFVAVPK
jgi:methyl-accepting chemotaxis protein-2 (aspartate sensor receptor)